MGGSCLVLGLCLCPAFPNGRAGRAGPGWGGGVLALAVSPPPLPAWLSPPGCGSAGASGGAASRAWAAVYVRAKFAARRPGVVPGGCRRNLPPLPPAAAVAPHSSGLSNNFPSEGGWAGARRGAARASVPPAAPQARGSGASAARRSAASTPCPGSRGRRGAGGEAGVPRRAPRGRGRIARAPGGGVGLTLALIVELAVPAARPVWWPARGEHAKFASMFCSTF